MFKKSSRILIFLGIAVVLVGVGVGLKIWSVEEKNPYAVQENMAEETLLTKGSEIELQNENTVIWTVPELGVLAQNNINYLNELLARDGHEINVVVKTAGIADTYNNEIEKMLKDGTTDIVYTGMYENEQIALPFIEKGYLEEFNTYLETTKGEDLKKAFHPVEWESVDFDGKYYVLPAQDLDAEFYVAFNKEYISKEEAKRFSGDWKDLLKYLDALSEKKEMPKVPLVWTMDSCDALEAYGYQKIYGFMGDIKSGRLYHPFELTEYQELMGFLNTAIKKGYLGENYTVGSLEGMSDAIESGEYVMLAGYSQSFISEYRSQLTVIPVKRCKWRVDGDGCTGIAAKSGKKEKAFELLNLIYTNKEYANALVYGKEKTDYHTEEGYVVEKSEGTLPSFVYGLYDLVIPEKGAEFAPDISMNKKQYFESDICQKSVFLKFHLNVTERTEELVAANDILGAEETVCMAADFEKEYQRVKLEQIENSNELKSYIQEEFNKWYQVQK